MTERAIDSASQPRTDDDCRDRRDERDVTDECCDSRSRSPGVWLLGWLLGSPGRVGVRCAYTFEETLDKVSIERALLPGVTRPMERPPKDVKRR